MPGTPGNTNAVRHGGRSRRSGVVLARLGRRFNSAYVDSLRLRRKVDALLKSRYGTLTLLQDAKINTVCRLEQSCRACELLISTTPAMPAEEIARQRSLICQWSCQRDNLLSVLLGDSAGVADPWSALDASRHDGQHVGTSADNPQAIPPSDATGAIVGDCGGGEI
jgi:hypothetical protein